MDEMEMMETQNYEAEEYQEEERNSNGVVGWVLGTLLVGGAVVGGWFATKKMRRERKIEKAKRLLEENGYDWSVAEEPEHNESESKTEEKVEG